MQAGDQRQAFGALLHQRLDQIEWRSRHCKAAKRNGAAIGNVGDGVRETTS